MNYQHKALIEAILEEGAKSKTLENLGKVIRYVPNKLASMKKGHIDFTKLKDRYGDLLKPSIGIRKTQVAKKAKVESALDAIQKRSVGPQQDIKAVQDELERRWAKSPARKPNASAQQKAKWKETEAAILSKAKDAEDLLKRRQAGMDTIVNNFNTSTKGVGDKLNNLRGTAAERAKKLRKIDMIDNVVSGGLATGAGATAITANKALKTKQSEYTYEKLQNAVKACKQSYNSPEDIKKCQNRLYAKYKTSKIRQTIDSITG
jgi:hypothetical protein